MHFNTTIDVICDMFWLDLTEYPALENLGLALNEKVFSVQNLVICFFKAMPRFSKQGQCMMKCGTR